MRSVLSLALVIGSVSALSAAEPPADVWAAAARNAAQAQEVFVRCNRLVHAWYAHQGKDSFLLPQNLRSRVWNAHNSAADLWSFFVLTAYLTDQKVLGSLVRQTLADDIRLATRVGRLTDDYDIDRNAFVNKSVDAGRLLFGNAEYVKDGLLPIVELMGETVWFDRGRELVEDLMAQAPVETRFGRIPSESAEVNGDMLQNLCRFAWATGDARFREWAFRIGDAYFLDALLKCNDLPCHGWNFAAGKPSQDMLSLCDHGNEAVFGLSEVMVLAHYQDKERGPKYVEAMRRMVDKLLAIAVNEDGLWFHALQPSTGTVLNRGTPDTWGYALDAVYALHLVTGDAKYRDAVARALRGINAKPQYRAWGGSDAFADSIEGGLVLLNRIPEPQGFAWLEATVPTFLAKQRPDGIIEGWHGDGNYARTALMYALMKTAGIRVSDWRPDLQLGAVVHEGKLFVHLAAARSWEGKLHFDYRRHQHHLRLPLNYPRLNEFPEWYPLLPEYHWSVTVNDQAQKPVLGSALIGGLEVKAGPEPTRILVAPVGDTTHDVPPAPVDDLPGLLQAAGTRAEPRRPDVRLAATLDGQRLRALLGVDQPWSGVIRFDYPRGLTHLGRRVSRPAQADLKRWYAIEPTRLYAVVVNSKGIEPLMGDDLLLGLPLKVEKEATIVVEPLPGPPYGGQALRLEGPAALGGDGPFRLPVTVVNDTDKPQAVRLAADFGTVAPTELKLDAGGKAEAVLTGTLTEERQVTLTATAQGLRPAVHVARLVRAKDLVSLVAFDDQEYQGTRYQWCGRAPFQFALAARKGQPHTLHLLWGAKGDQRGAVLTLNGKPRTVAHGGYNGFQWVKVPIEADLVTGDTLTVHVAPDPKNDRAAFLSEARLTSP